VDVRGGAMKAAHRRATLCCGLLLFCGCAGWQEQWVRPDHLVAKKQPSQIRVTVRDGSQVILFDPVADGDSLVGWDRARPPNTEFTPIECRPDPAKQHERRQLGVAMNDIVSTALWPDEAGSVPILITTGIAAVSGSILLLLLAFPPTW
jgi:hypothetical protein